MAKRRLSHYQLFMASYLRAHLKAGATRQEARAAMREGAKAWRRAMAGHNPFPSIHLDFVEGDHNFHGADEGELHGAAEAVACPDCGADLEIPTSLAGKEVSCPACGAEFQVEVQ